MSLTLPNAIGSTDANRTDDPFFEATWRDTESEATGYLVIDRLVRGISSGGLRMRAGCTLNEVRGLARGMTLKEAIHFEEGARLRPARRRQGRHRLRPVPPRRRRRAEPLPPGHGAAHRAALDHGRGLRVRQDAVDAASPRSGSRARSRPRTASSTTRAAAVARMKTAFTAVVDGVTLDELVGGYGVAEAALAAMDAKGLDPAADPGRGAGLRIDGRRHGAATSPRPACASSASPTCTASSRTRTVSTSRRCS